MMVDDDDAVVVILAEMNQSAAVSSLSAVALN
jgi:hypothetical protein